MFTAARIQPPLRKLFIILSQLGMICLLLTACRPSGLNLDQSPLLRVLERKSGLIAYIGLDENIYTIDQGGTNQKTITSDAQIPSETGEERLVYRVPTWSWDGKKLAYVGIQSSNGSLDAGVVYTAGRDGDGQVEAFRSDEHLPFYMDWSPNNELLAFLSLNVSEGNLTLQSVPVTGGEVKEIGISSSSLYWDWSPAKQSVLVHLGGAAKEEPEAHMSLLDVGTETPEKRLDLLPSVFRAPAWSPNGEEVLLAAEIDGGKEGLVLADHQGALKKVITVLEGPVSFGWSPDGKRLAYLSRNSPDIEGAPNLLTVLDPANPEETKWTLEGLIFAFFWSPDSRKVAYFTPTLVPTASETEDASESVSQLFYTLNMLDVRDGKRQEINTFQPTESFADTLALFDQYQHATTFWSPDSKNLVISAMDSDDEPGIFVVEASGNLKPRFVASGLLAFWSWR